MAVTGLIFTKIVFVR